MSKTTTDKPDVYQVVTDRVVAMLESGTVPWHKPWNGGSAPRNLQDRPYRGVNTFLLGMTAIEQGYTSPYWLTFKQAKERGGSVQKGQHGTLIVFWKRILVKEKDSNEKKVVPLLRYYYVFNLNQTEGVKLPKAVAEAESGEHDVTPNLTAEQVLAGYANPPRISENGTEAVYSPDLDRVVVPPRSTFTESDEFYSTLFHEIGHSTGHESRLNRFAGKNHTFGCHDYGREELVAEMTSAFLCAEAGISSTMANTAAYLRSWVSTIKEDTHAVVVAAGQAQRAADLVLGRTFEDAPAVPEMAKAS